VKLGSANWTLIAFSSPDAAKAAHNKLQLLVTSFNYTVHHAHWTTGDDIDLFFTRIPLNFKIICSQF
jgi:hypothetical protein